MVELSRHEDFHAIYRQAEMKVDHSTDCSALVEFDDLEPRTVWHHRTYLYNPRKGFDGPSAGFGLIGESISYVDGIRGYTLQLSVNDRGRT